MTIVDIFLDLLLANLHADRYQLREERKLFNFDSYRQCYGLFLGLPDPDPLVRGMDQDPDPSIIMQK
jgi:hypothetical protein